MRRQAHVLLAAGNDDVRIAAFDSLGGEVHGLEAAAADLVDGHGGHRMGQAGSDRGLARRVLAFAGGQHLSQDDLVDLRRVQAGLFQ